MDISRLSVCNYPIRTRSLDETFDMFSACGFRKVDLWGGPPHYSNDPAQCDVAQLRKRATSSGITIANLGTYPGRRLLEDGEEAEWIEMTRAIDNAAFLGCRSLRVCPAQGEDPAIIPDIAPFFRKAAAYAVAKGILLGMENHKGSLAGNPDTAMRLVTEVGSPYFGILYEPANLMAGKVDYRDAYVAFRGHVVHVHVKDSHWVNERYHRTMLGKGDVDLSWVRDVLEADGYTGDYALEYEIENIVPIEEGLPAWLDYALAL
ncbi:MAG: sugar phosphate isomerase/epimerase [Lentisphaeria bacterium]|nr:sugar phosphate isomerase/epimerase [Lentisphaeria bacterium]